MAENKIFLTSTNAYVLHIVFMQVIFWTCKDIDAGSTIIQAQSVMYMGVIYLRLGDLKYAFMPHFISEELDGLLYGYTAATV